MVTVIDETLKPTGGLLKLIDSPGLWYLYLYLRESVMSVNVIKMRLNFSGFVLSAVYVANW